MKIVFGSIASLALLAAVALNTGCGLSSAEAKGEGKVSYKGTPITEGAVNFISKEKGIGAISKIEATGSFSIPAGLVPGQYAISVTPPASAPPPPGTPYTPPVTSIPLKARDPSTSGVTVALQGGKNDVVVELTD